MTASAGTVTVEVTGRDVNLAQLLTALETRMKQADATGVRLAQTTSGTLASSQQRAANSALATAAAYSRLAVAEGEPVRAAGLLRAALDSNVGASERVRVSLQATATRLESGTTAFTQFGEAAKSSLLGVIGPAALATGAIAGAIRVVSSFGEAFKFKADLDSSTAAINNQIRGIRDANQVWQEATAFAHRYGITQQETNAILTSSTDVLRTSKSSVTDLESTLLRLQSRDISKPISEAARALRELQAGDTTSIKELFNIPAAAANRMKTEIAGGADAVQVLSTYLTGAGAGMEVLEQRTKGAAGAMHDLEVAQEQLKLAQAEFAQGPGMGFLGLQTVVTRDLAHAMSGDLKPALLDAGGGFAGLSAQQQTSLATFIATRDAAKAQEQGIIALVATYARYISGTNEATNASAAQAQASIVAGGAISYQSQAMIDAAIAGQPAAKAILEVAAASEQSAEKSIVDAANKDAQSAQTALLEAQTRNAADAFLALNPNIDAAGIAALVAAGKIPPLVGQLLAAEAAAHRAQAALIAFNNAQNVAAVSAKINTDRSAGRIGRGDNPSEQRGIEEAAIRNNQAIAAAQRERTLAVGSETDRRRLLNRELQDATRLYGAHSAGAIRAQTALDQEEERLDKKSKGRKAKGTGAGGAPKLSDQQRLNNTLLADQEKADRQFEDLDLKHAKRLLAIDRDANQKRLEADRQFHQDRVDSEASFYDQLRSVKDPGARKQADEEYQAAILEAERRGGDAGKAYLDAQNAIIQQRAKRRDEIAGAEEKGDTSEAEYLRGLQALDERAAAVRLQNVEAQGSAIEQERQKQLADENLQYEEQSGKIADTADRAAQAKVTAAQRAGKAVDAENAKLTEQARLYDRIAASSGGRTAAPASAPAAPVAPGATPTAAAPATSTSPAAPTGDVNPIVAALQAAQEAIVGALGAVERNTRDTVGAVKSARASGGVAG